MSKTETPERVLSVKISVYSSDLDLAIEEANRLAELLREASGIIDSLSVHVNQNPN